MTTTNRPTRERIAEIRERDAESGDLRQFRHTHAECDRRDLLAEIDALTVPQLKHLDNKFGIDAERRVVKYSNGDPIPEDEPVFLFRARDWLALDVLRYYQQRSQEDGCTDYHTDGLQRAIGEFERFRRDHTERMKQPGITRGL